MLCRPVNPIAISVVNKVYNNNFAILKASDAVFQYKSELLFLGCTHDKTWYDNA